MLLAIDNILRIGVFTYTLCLHGAWDQVTINAVKWLYHLRGECHTFHPIKRLNG